MHMYDIIAINISPRKLSNFRSHLRPCHDSSWFCLRFDSWQFLLTRLLFRLSIELWPVPSHSLCQGFYQVHVWSSFLACHRCFLKLPRHLLPYPAWKVLTCLYMYRDRVTTQEWSYMRVQRPQKAVFSVLILPTMFLERPFRLHFRHIAGQFSSVFACHTGCILRS